MSIPDKILDTVEAYLDLRWDRGGPDLKFGPRTTGENATVRMMRVDADGETYLVVAKRVGGPDGGR